MPLCAFLTHIKSHVSKYPVIYFFLLTETLHPSGAAPPPLSHGRTHFGPPLKEFPSRSRGWECLPVHKFAALPARLLVLRANSPAVGLSVCVSVWGPAEPLRLPPCRKSSYFCRCSSVVAACLCVQFHNGRGGGGRGGRRGGGRLSIQWLQSQRDALKKA